MTDVDDLERSLRRYQPAGPRDAMRARVLATTRPSPIRRLLPWLPAAVAAAAILIVHVIASGMYVETARKAAERYNAARLAAIERTTTLLGGGEMARLEAERQMDEAERAEQFNRPTQRSGAPR